MKKTIAIMAITLLSSTSLAHTNRANLDASIRVIQALNIKITSDVIFPDAVQGSPTYTLLPGNQEDRNNGSFEVQGEPGKTVHLLIPTNNSIKMRSRNGDEILIEKIILNSSSIILNPNGKNTVFVGAAREAISFSHSPGEYKGQFTITAIY